MIDLAWLQIFGAVLGGPSVASPSSCESLVNTSLTSEYQASDFHH